MSFYAKALKGNKTESFVETAKSLPECKAAPLHSFCKNCGEECRYRLRVIAITDK